MGCYFIAQFCSAFNDNAFKMVISMAALAMQPEGGDGRAAYLSLTTAVFILPFLLFSGWAGFLADRYRKDRVLMFSKSFEIVAMVLAFLVFWENSHLKLLLATLFLMATHSAFFSPAKYGILPEILAPHDVAKANGYLMMTTYVAIIGGTLFGGYLWEFFSDDHVFIGAVLLAVAVGGTAFVYFIPKAPSGHVTARFDPNPLHEIGQCLPLVWRNPLLRFTLVASVLFWFMASLLYLVVLVYGREALHVSETKASALFAAAALGIGLGAIWAGHTRTGTRRLRLVLYGQLLLSAALLALGLLNLLYYQAFLLMSLLGLGSGLFVLPLLTLLQAEAPVNKRGQVMATSNFFDMAAILVSSLLFWVLHGLLGLTGQMIMLGSGIVVVAGLVLLIPALRHVRRCIIA